MPEIEELSETNIENEILKPLEKDIETHTIKKISNNENKFYSPLVKSIAKKEGITNEELDGIIGTGSNSRVTKKDILNFLKNRTEPIISIGQKLPVEKTKTFDHSNSSSTPQNGENEIFFIV